MESNCGKGLEAQPQVFGSFTPTGECELPSVSVVVLNYNGWTDTVECVKSLRASTYRQMGIIVVDNGSTDDSEVQLRSFLDPLHIPLLQTGSNLGVAGGNNHGIRDALQRGAELIFILNNDLTVAPDFLEHLIRVAMSQERVGAVGPKILYADEPEYIWDAGDGMNPWLARTPPLCANKPAAAFVGTWEVEALIGCALLVKRKVFEDLGMFDERYFFQCEDLEFSYRLKKAGWCQKVSMDSRVYHKVSRTVSPTSYDRWYYATRNRLLFIRENLSLPQRVTSRAFFWGTRPLKFCEWMLRGRPDLIKATFRGWRDYRNRLWGRRRG